MTKASEALDVEYYQAQEQLVKQHASAADHLEEQARQHRRIEAGARAALEALSEDSPPRPELRSEL